MPIPTSSVVNVSISVGAQAPSRSGFGLTNIVTAELGVIGPAERSRLYFDSDGVAADWAAGSEVVAAAATHFSQQPRPTSLRVSARFPDDQPGEVRGGAVAEDSVSIAAISAITDGSFSVSIDGAPAVDIVGMDFSTLTTMDDFANVVQIALRAIASGGYTNATCTYSSDRFFINSGTVGAASAVLFPVTTSPLVGTDISSLFQLQMGEATLSSGFNGETITASLSAIEDSSDDWYFLAFTREIRDLVLVNGEPAVMAAAIWCEARTKSYFTVSNDLDSYDSVSEASIGHELSQASLKRTNCNFSSRPSQYLDVSAMARAGTTNFGLSDSTITLKFQQMPSITPEDLTRNQKAIMDGRNMNAYVEIGSNEMYAESFMVNGTFFDELHGLDWLVDATRTNVFGHLLTKGTKVAHSDKGLAEIEQQVARALDEARRNGLIAPGYTNEGEFLPSGYKVTVTPFRLTPESDVVARFNGGISFLCIGSGALHGLQINGVFER